MEDEAGLPNDAPDETPDDALVADDASEVAVSGADIPFDSAVAPEGESAMLAAPFVALLRSLRTLPGPCAPPVGEGAFDILYASAREIVVWFTSAKDGVGQKEVAIPTRLACAAWELLLRGEPVDEAALRAIAAGLAGGRWLLALLAQLPTVEVRSAAAGDGADGETSEIGETCVLVWRGDPGAAGDVDDSRAS